MDMNDFLGGQYMTKNDVDVRGIDCVITGLTTETVGDEKDVKPCLHVKGGKPIILNKTNIRILCALFGNDSDKWLNNFINVFNDPSVNFNGANGGLRVRESRLNQAPVPTTPAVEAAAALYAAEANATAKTTMPNDDVPF